MLFAILFWAPEPTPEAPQPPIATTVPPVMEISTSASTKYFALPELIPENAEPIPEPPAIFVTSSSNLSDAAPFAMMSPPVMLISALSAPTPSPIPAPPFTPPVASIFPPLISILVKSTVVISVVPRPLTPLSSFELGEPPEPMPAAPSPPTAVISPPVIVMSA